MSEAALYYDEKTCKICGNTFSVLHPNRWAYKRGCTSKWTYFCSWKCLRAYDQMKETERKEQVMGDVKMRLKPEQKEMAIQKYYEGGSKAVYEYLRSCGIKNEIKCWKNIQDRLKKINPEEAKKLVMAKAQQKVKQIDTQETVTLNGPVKIETPEGKTLARIDVPKVPAKGIEYKVTGISTGIGEFQYYKRNDYLDWSPIGNFNDTVSLKVEEWKELLKVLPEAAKVLGVDINGR